MILAEERTTEEEKHHILEARRRAAAKKKKLKSLGGKNVSTDTEDETEEQGELGGERNRVSWGWGNRVS